MIDDILDYENKEFSKLKSFILECIYTSGIDRLVNIDNSKELCFTLSISATPGKWIIYTIQRGRSEFFIELEFGSFNPLLQRPSIEYFIYKTLVEAKK